MNLATLLSMFLIMSAAGYLLLGFRLMSARQRNRNVAIGFLAVAIAVWVAAGAVEMLATTSPVFAIGRAGHFLGAAFAPVLAYLGFRAYVGKATPALLTVALLVVPFVSVVLAATNAGHELMWFLPAASPDGQFLTRPEKWGLW